MTKDEWLKEEAVRQQANEKARKEAKESQQKWDRQMADSLIKVFFEAVKSGNPWSVTSVRSFGTASTKAVELAVRDLKNDGWDAYSLPILEMEGDFPGAKWVEIEGNKRLFVGAP